MSPSVSPLHKRASPVAVAIKTGSSVISAEVIAVQLLASVTVKLYIPADKPEGFESVPAPLSQEKM